MLRNNTHYTRSRCCGAKLDMCCALVATRAKKFLPGQKKSFYIWSTVMRESGFEVKLIKLEAIPGATLVKSKVLLQNVFRSQRGKHHMQKNRI